jgi:hypothetical protein
MKEWFLDCVRTVRREVAMRNSSGTVLNVDTISSIEEFKAVDKLRLLELFLQNEKMLVWMYERIFPDRLTQLQYSLRDQASTQQHEKQMSSIQFGQRLFPKVGRSTKSELRNSAVLRNGKLNISQL